MTLADFHNQVRTRAGLLARRAGDPTLVPTNADETQLTEYLRQGLVEIAVKTDRFEDTATISTVAGQAEYAVSAAIRHVQRATVVDASGAERDINHAGHTARAQATASQAQQGLPCNYVLFGGSLWLYPVPDAAYQVKLYYTLSGSATVATNNAAPDWLIE